MLMLSSGGARSTSLAAATPAAVCQAGSVILGEGRQGGPNKAATGAGPRAKSIGRRPRIPKRPGLASALSDGAAAAMASSLSDPEFDDCFIGGSTTLSCAEYVRLFTGYEVDADGSVLIDGCRFQADGSLLLDPEPAWIEIPMESKGESRPAPLCPTLLWKGRKRPRRAETGPIGKRRRLHGHVRRLQVIGGGKTAQSGKFPKRRK